MAQKQTSKKAAEGSGTELVTPGTWETSTGFLRTLMIADEDSDPWDRDFVLLGHPERSAEEEDALIKATLDVPTVGRMPGMDDRLAAAKEAGYVPLEEIPGAEED